jgi:hypothetical protein
MKWGCINWSNLVEERDMWLAVIEHGNEFLCSQNAGTVLMNYYVLKEDSGT